jgi:protein MpaA
MWATMGLLAAAGCQAPERVRTTGKEPTAPPERLVVGNSVEGRPIECLVFGSGGDVVLMLATIHGNEDAGTPLLHRLADYLSSAPAVLDGRRVVLIPLANPDGRAHRRRHNVRDVDLNRNFPASNYQGGLHHGSAALSEPESLAIHRVIGAYHPARMVSIHQPLNSGDACLDYDGPAEVLAGAMAAHTDLPVNKLGCPSGSLGSYAGIVLDIPIITVELPKEAGGWAPEVLWDRYGQMLLAAVVFPQPVPPARRAR